MKHKIFRSTLVLATAFVLALTLMGTAGAASPGSKTFTFDADFDEGTMVSLNHDDVHDQLQIDSEATPFEFIWVAASNRGTIIKIDTITGDILGEYWSAPEPMAKDPSRTTVDNNGNLWAGNRAEASGGKGSVVHIGLLENGQCVDRNGNGVIETSTGLGDIRPWTNDGSADTNGGVSTAEDECIIHFVRTAGIFIRTLAVDSSNNVWIGGPTLIGNGLHQLHDSNGVPIGPPIFLGCGGYGGLIDANGVLWSASYPFDPFLGRYDPSTETGICIPTLGRTSYGLGIDRAGNIWNSNFEKDSILKIDPSGTTISGPYSTGGDSGDRGVTVTPDDNVWVANSGGNNVSRLNSSGTVMAVITVGLMPTGLAVDAAGKVWVTNALTDNVMRIDPTSNLVDLIVSLGAGAYPYNYSDMTGSTLIAPPETGTWTVVYDSTMVDAPWSQVSWNSDEPDDSQITVKVASSADGITFGPEVNVVNGSSPAISNGRYIKVIVGFQRATNGETPVLYDLTVSTNRPPVADANGPYLFPLNAGPFDGTGSSDPDGDPLTYAWTFGDDGETGTGAEPYHEYLEAGIYNVCLTVNDGFVDSDEVCTSAVIYDPSAGFVTGGGWINSAPGAYVPDDTLTGKASFGFVSKYKKGTTVPEGNTEFQFHAADLNFHSSSYEWLVVTGSNYARYKGVGTINGEGEYKFMLWAGDGTGTDGADTFRIKIWTEDEFGVETVIYDNGMDQDIAGGSIVVHTKK